MLYPVNDLFETIQGEAKYTGTPSYFIRLQGCPVGCAWCDTQFTWYSDPRQIVAQPIILKKELEDFHFGEFTDKDLLDVVNKASAKHVVITGGEPCLYDLNDLCDTLTNNGYTVQIETSGTHEVKAPDNVWVTVSPKVDMPGQFKLVRQAIERANEIKMPIGKQKDIDNLNDLIKEYNIDVDIWLQPLSQSNKATQLCVEQSIKNNWKISVQTHKYINQK